MLRYRRVGLKLGDNLACGWSARREVWMKGNELRDRIRQERRETQFFIKWWRREHDFMYFELIDDLLAQVTDDQEFEGYVLMSMEEMWEHLQKIEPEHLSREQRTHGEVVVWKREQEGEEKTEICPFTPKNLMTIFDVETKGMVIG
jgi:hypothetical protein